MAKQSNGKMWTAVTVLLALVIVFVLLVPRTRAEYFEVGPAGATLPNTIDMYNSSTNQSTFVSDYVSKWNLNILDDKEKLLHFRACYQFNKTTHALPSVMAPYINNSSYRVVDLGAISTNSFNDVETKIIDAISKACMELRAVTQNPNAKLVGPIEVILAQAPSYKADDGSTMSIQFNLESYGFLPVNISNGKSIAENAMTPLRYKVYVNFGAYQRNMSRRTNVHKFDVAFGNYRKRNQEHCMIQCANASSQVCGCLSGTVADQGYESKCIAPVLNAQTETQKNTPVLHDFPVCYVVNAKNVNVLNFMQTAAAN